MQSTCLLDGSQRTVRFNSVTFYCTLYIVIQIHSQLDFHLERGESLPLCNSRRRNHVVWSNREEGSGHCSICKSFSVSKCLPLTSRHNLRILCIKKKEYSISLHRDDVLFKGICQTFNVLLVQIRCRLIQC